MRTHADAWEQERLITPIDAAIRLGIKNMGFETSNLKTKWFNQHSRGFYCPVSQRRFL
jgi:hypothetical protein